MTDSLSRLAKRIRDVEATVRAATTTPQLAYSSIEDGALAAHDIDGNQTMQIGKQYDGTATAAVLTGPVPLVVPTAPVVTPMPGGLKIVWDGLFTDPLGVVPMDFTGVDVVLGGAADFDPIATVAAHRFTSARGGEVFLALDPATYWVALVLRTQAGKWSDPSALSSAAAPAIEIPDVLPPDPPVASPAATVTPLGVMALQASWPSVADATLYDVYVSAASMTATPASVDQIGTTASTAMSISRLPSGSALAPGVPYYVRVVARNEGGAAPAAGVEGSGTVRQADSGDIAPSYVYTGGVEAEQITTGNLNALLALVGGLTAGESGGRRIELTGAGGLKVLDADGQILVHFPTTLDALNVFTGDLVASGLTTTGRASFRGNDNEISRNSSFTLASGTTRPSNAPSVAAGSVNPNDVPAGFGFDGKLHQEGNTLYSVENTGSVYSVANKMFIWDMTTGAAGAVTSWSLPGSLATQNDITSIAKIGSTFYALHWVPGGYSDAPAYSTQGWWITPFTQAAVGSSFRANWPNANFSDGTSHAPYESGQGPTLGTDGTSLLVATKNAAKDVAGPLQVYFLNPAGGGWTASPLVSTTSVPALQYPRQITKGTYDRSGARYVVTYTDTNDYNRVVFRGHSTSTLDEIAAETARIDGFSGAPHWDAAGLRWYVMAEQLYMGPTSAYRYKLSKNIDTTPIWVGYSWRDSDAGGTGIHETTLSPLVKFTPSPYQPLAITLPVDPADAGDPDSPDSARWYAKRSVAQPVEANMRMISDITAGAGGSRSFVSLDLLTNTTAPPAANTFPDGSAGQIKSSVGGFIVKGDGTGTWPYLESALTSSITSPLDARLDVLETFVGCRAYANVTVSCPNATVTVIPLAGETFDSTGSMHSTSTNNSRIVIPETGRYFIFAAIVGNLINNVMQTRVHKNGAFLVNALAGNQGGSNLAKPFLFDIFSFNAGDYLELAIHHSSGAAINVNGSESETFLAAIKVA